MNKTTNEIKKEFLDSPIENIHSIIEIYKNDERKLIKDLILKYEKKYLNYLNELERVKNLHTYENRYKDKENIAGIDEVGRGPLAGPVVTAAVILPKNCVIIGIDDSKKLTSKKRETLYNEIKEKALSIGIGIVTNSVIDEINILQATIKAMKMSIEKLNITPNQLLIDAVKLPDINITQESIIKGDSQSISIAAASIIAKVTRDNMMIEYDKVFPEYDFINNKGYGSKKHIEAIKKYGLCPLHRKTFVKNFVD